MTGLTKEERVKWCKSKADYKPLWLKKNKTATEIATLRRMMEEYRDWNRHNDIVKKGNPGIKYTPSKHKSKIFDDLKSGGYRDGG